MILKSRSGPWSDACIHHVREELIKAMAVLRLLPLSRRDLPGNMRPSWPSFSRGHGLAGGTRTPARRKATPEEISHMEYWIELSRKLDQSSRRIVLARAGRIPWRRLEEIDGRSHTTLRKIERTGLEQIAAAHKEFRR